MLISWTKPSLSLLTLIGFVGLMSNLQLLTPCQFLYSPAVKERLILDLRHVNRSLIKQRVKYEDWKMLWPIFP